jgi:crotonobetainyl-CoA:carnitine CoA-transferase CaiB-like acyl-CoA transferase
VKDDAGQKRQPLPLEGLRILGVTQYGAGPWATMILADLGAEIIKIEDPNTGGDVARYVPPYTAEQDSVYFQSLNRNTKSITLDLKHAAATEVLHGLVAVSDGILNNLRGDVPAKLGLDYASLAPVKKALVCCSLSAFGRTGARAAEPGYDYLMQGYAGWMSLTGEPGGPPQKTGLSLVDFAAAELAALGMLSAIMRARSTGIGCDVDVALFNTALFHLSYPAAWHLTKGYQPTRMADSSHPSQVPSQILPTKDGHLVIMCAKEKFYRNLVSILGVPELADDPRFNSFAARLENRDALVPLLKTMSRKKTTDQWLDLLRGQVPCAPVNTVEQAFSDPQVAQDEMIIATDHPAFGSVRQVANPIKISDAQKEHHRAPALGEHTDELLTEYLHLTTAQIKRLHTDGVI